MSCFVLFKEVSMKKLVYLFFPILISIFSTHAFAVGEEIKCLDGPTVPELQVRVNQLIQQLAPYTSSISAPALMLKHSGVANPYVMCVTVTYK